MFAVTNDSTNLNTKAVFDEYEKEDPDEARIFHLITKGVNVDAVNEYGQSILMIAVQEDYREAINVLLNMEGIKVNEIDEFGNSIVDILKFQQNTEALGILAEKGLIIKTAIFDSKIFKTLTSFDEAYDLSNEDELADKEVASFFAKPIAITPTTSPKTSNKAHSAFSLVSSVKISDIGLKRGGGGRE
jgi:ankyrin repeat protein